MVNLKELVLSLDGHITLFKSPRYCRLRGLEFKRGKQPKAMVLHICTKLTSVSRFFHESLFN